MKEEYTCETYSSIGKKYNGEIAIISLTSWKKRINTVGKTIFNLIKNCPKYHIVLTLFKDEFPNKINNLPEDLKLFINNNLIEIIWANFDLKPHLKYFYTMKKYKTVPIITVDDDCLYTKESIDILYSKYLNNPNNIICNRSHLIIVNNNEINTYNKWKWCINESSDNRHIFPTGVGGVLYPPNILDIDNINLDELKSCLYADDIYLKILENRKEINYTITKIKNKHPIELVECKITGLNNINVSLNRNDEYIKLFKNDLI